MKFFIDSADTDAIAQFTKSDMVDGVTKTLPLLLNQEKILRMLWLKYAR